MISLANHPQTEQGWFYVNFDGRLASFYIHENPQKKSDSFLLYQVAQFHLQIVNNYAYLRLPSIWLVCYGATLNYLNMYNGINLNYEYIEKKLIVSKHRIIIFNCFLNIIFIIIIISSDISK